MGEGWRVERWRAGSVVGGKGCVMTSAVVQGGSRVGRGGSSGGPRHLEGVAACQTCMELMRLQVFLVEFMEQKVNN